ncbi:MAG: hypothetical protein PHQ11_13190 [Paludibacter sp.]|nr:hypothetical protein [Paludibacter sp.]
MFYITNTCDYLKNLISEGKAVYALKIVCKNTLYRDFVSFDTEEYTYLLPFSKILNSVTITPYIVALDDLAEYRCDSFHPDYSGEKFSIRIGDPLGIGDTICIDAPTENEANKTPESIIKYIFVDKEYNTIDVDSRGDIIYVRIPKTMQSIGRLNTSRILWENPTKLLLSMIVVPALTQVLSQTFNSEFEKEEQEEEYNTLQWFRVLKTALLRHNLIEIEDDGTISTFDAVSESPLEAAQLIVGEPLFDAASVLNRIFLDSHEEED